MRSYYLAPQPTSRQRCLRFWLRLRSGSGCKSISTISRENDLTFISTFIHRHGIYTLLNILGLAIGMSACLLVILYLEHELSYDTQHEDLDRLHRVVRHVRPPDGSPEFDGMGLQFRAMKDLPLEIPEIEATTGFTMRPMWAGLDDRGFDVLGMIARENFLEVLTYPLLSGGRPKLTPSDVYVTESFARKLYGTTDVVGQPLKIYYKWIDSELRIGGVLRDIPPTTSGEFKFDILYNHRASNTEANDPFDHIEWEPDTFWTVIRTIARVAPGTDLAALQPKLDDFARRHLGDAIGTPGTYRLMPLERLHLYAHRELAINMTNVMVEPFGDIDRCYAFGLIGLFVLILASVNFVNLATARASRRGLEVGVHKACGATRRDLIQKFLGESVLLCGGAGAAAVGLTYLLAPFASELLQVSLEITLSIWAFAALLAVLVGLLAGFYPSIVLASFQPATVLKGSGQTSGGGSRTRQALVVFQFTISVILIIGVIVARAQMDYVRGLDLGFAQKGRIVLPVIKENQGLREKFDTVRTRFRRVPGVLDLTVTQFPPGHENDVDRVYIRKSGGTDSTNVHWVGVDDRFEHVYEVEILEGRGIQSTDFRKPTLVINQTAARALGVGVGDLVKAWGPDDFTIVGIFRDFHNRSVHYPIRPLLIEFWPSFDFVTVKVDGRNLSGTISGLEAAWKDFHPNRVFKYEFLDEHIAAFYDDDIRSQKAFTVLATLAIVIACLGLLGLIAFTTELRTKEIGVRKVLGSSTSEIVIRLLREFARLIAIATVLSWPISWYVSQQWLQNYTYRIELGPVPFIFGGLIALTVALATISAQSIRAANLDPTDALRSE